MNKKVKISKCCNSEIYLAPSFYTTNMKNIPNVNVCLNCGYECSTILK